MKQQDLKAFLKEHDLTIVFRSAALSLSKHSIDATVKPTIRAEFISPFGPVECRLVSQARCLPLSTPLAGIGNTHQEALIDLIEKSSKLESEDTLTHTLKSLRTATFPEADLEVLLEWYPEYRTTEKPND